MTREGDDDFRAKIEYARERLPLFSYSFSQGYVAGRDWTGPPLFREIVRCLLGRHQDVLVSLTIPVTRCVCGAFGPWPYTHLDKGWRRYVIGKWIKGWRMSDSGAGDALP